jgi:hypothetical protein
MPRIVALEEAVSRMKQAVADLEARPENASGPARSRAEQTQTRLPLIIGTALTALGGIVAYWLQQQGASARWFVVLGFSSPLPLALYIAVRPIFRSISQYLRAGALQGAALSLVSFEYAVISYRPDGPPAEAVNIGSNLIFDAIVVMLYALLYVSIGLFRMYFSRKEKGSSYSDLSRRVAFNIMGRPSIIPGEKAEARLKHFSEVMAALAPVLSLLGTIIAAYFAYRGATKQP